MLEITSSSTGSSSSGTGGDGGAGGSSCAPSCANGQSCVDGKDCQSGYCAKSGGAAGTCEATKKQGLDCTADGECGTGHCTDGVCCDVVSCGDECLSCAASTGTCKAKTGSKCGMTCGDGKVTAGQCDSAGKCAGPASTMPCMSNFGCNPATNTCNDKCTSNADCASTGFCVMPATMCAGCGVYPPGSMCTAGMGGCETCDPNGDNACVKTCDTAGECVITKTLDASKAPVRLVCNDQCNGIAINCLGPFPCEVTCDTNGCFGLTLNCGKDGPCKLTCTGAGCPDAKMKCGSNECIASCPVGTNAIVTQSCADSCGCAKVNCQ